MNTNKNIVTQLHDLKYDSTKLHTWNFHKVQKFEVTQIHV